MSAIDHLLYALAWLSFGIGHSLMSGATRDRGIGRMFGRGHRLAFNMIALGHLAAVLLAGRLLAAGAAGFALPAWLIATMNTMVVAGLVFGAIALRGYRAGPFVGWTQLRGTGGDAETPLVVSGLNRWVRHPLYSAAFLLLFGFARSELALATAVWASVYLVIGSRFEERRLIARYGEAYRAYWRRTGAFAPLPIRRFRGRE